MFISIFEQYGTFFLILIGVIVLLSIGYVIFSRPRKVKNNEPVIKAKNKIQKEVIKEVKTSKPEKATEQPKPKQVIEEKPVKDIVLEPEEFSNEETEENADQTIEIEEQEEIKSDVSDDFKKIDEVIEAERDELELEENYDEGKIVEPDAKEHLQKADKMLDDLISKVEGPKELGKYHVLYRKEEDNWYIKREGSEKITKVLPTQKEAIAFATIKAINQKTSVVIHKRDGKIRKQSY